MSRENKRRLGALSGFLFVKIFRKPFGESMEVARHIMETLYFAAYIKSYVQEPKPACDIETFQIYT